MAITITPAELADLLHRRGPSLVLTGAGISTESGIPDYRGADGRRRVVPMSQQEFMATSAARQRYWARSYAGWHRFAAAEPNAGHAALASLQSSGVLGPIITQNVDGLHQQAGAREVIELHGTLSSVVCLRCDNVLDRDFVQALMADANPYFERFITGLESDGSRASSQVRPDGDVVLSDQVTQDFVAPRCPRCHDDLLKPDVVFFGGAVPKPRVEQCFALTDSASMLLVLGSSLQVMSGYRFVRRAAAHGIPIVIVTQGPTRGDAESTHRIDHTLGETLTETARGIRQRLDAA